MGFYLSGEFSHWGLCLTSASLSFPTSSWEGTSWSPFPWWDSPSSGPAICRRLAWPPSLAKFLIFLNSWDFKTSVAASVRPAADPPRTCAFPASSLRVCLYLQQLQMSWPRLFITHVLGFFRLCSSLRIHISFAYYPAVKSKKSLFDTEEDFLC